MNTRHLPLAAMLAAVLIQWPLAALAQTAGPAAAPAAEAWARRAHDRADHGIEAVVHGLGHATAWTGAEAKAGASAAASAARSVVAELDRGAVWARDEAAKSFASLGADLNKLGHAIGSRVQATPPKAHA
jgi:hypothetical protein